MICKNCKETFEGNFCSHCGQSAKVNEINFKYLLNEIPNSIFQVDRGYFFTVKELFIRPGYSIREFIGGKRKSHFKPLSFLILTSAVYVLLNYLIGEQTFYADFIEGFQLAADQEYVLLSWLSEHQVYFVATTIVFFSLASYLVFIKSGYNFFEHLILNVYIAGQQMIIYILFAFFNKNTLTTTMPILLAVAFTIWTYMQFFNNKPKTRKILLISLTYIVYILLFFLIPILILLILKASGVDLLNK